MELVCCGEKISFGFRFQSKDRVWFLLCFRETFQGMKPPEELGPFRTAPKVVCDAHACGWPTAGHPEQKSIFSNDTKKKNKKRKKKTDGLICMKY